MWKDYRKREREKERDGVESRISESRPGYVRVTLSTCYA